MGGAQRELVYQRHQQAGHGHAAVSYTHLDVYKRQVYDDKTGRVVRYNIFSARLLVRHDEDGKKYLYDLLAIKKETSSPLES